MLPRSTPLVLLALTAPLAAQATNFGTGCPGGSGVIPTISCTPPLVGQQSTITVTGPPISSGVIIAGFSNTSWNGLPLPFDVSFLPAPGCSLLVSVDVQQPVVMDPLGSFAAASGVGPVGSSIYLQAFLLDFGPTTIGGMSNGIELITQSTGGGGGDLVITEVMKNPSFVNDSDGEYFEVFNSGAGAVDVEGWTIRDDGSDIHLIDNGGSGVVIPAGAYFTFGVNGDPGTNGNITIDYVWAAGTFFLSNSSDEIVLVDLTASEADRIVYDDGIVWPDLTGVAMELHPTALTATDNDDGSNWNDSTCTIAGGPTCNDDLGTPRQANDVCNTSPCGPPPPLTENGDVIVTEIMQNPIFPPVSDGDGEWFEVLNTTGGAIDIEGWTVSDEGADSHVIDVGGAGLLVPAGGRLVLGRNADTAVNGGVTLDYVYTGLNLANGDDEVMLTDGGGALQDRVAYDGGLVFPDPDGASMVFSPTATQDASANNDGASWCTSITFFGDGSQLGTPGAGNDGCP